MNVWVENMKSARTGEPVKNQMLVHVTTDKEEVSTFFSYSAKIFELYTRDGKRTIALGEKWDYSVTTGKYRDQALERLLGEKVGKKTLEKGLRDGFIVLSGANVAVTRDNFY